MLDNIIQFKPNVASNVLQFRQSTDNIIQFKPKVAPQSIANDNVKCCGKPQWCNKNWPCQSKFNLINKDDIA